MQRKRYGKSDLILPLSRVNDQGGIGNKAANIQRLARLGMRVPVTYVLSWEAYRRYSENDLSIIDQVIKELADKLNPNGCYAVRSSANIEDSFDHSFAGQFKTVLHVQGTNALMQAIWSVWATARTPEVEEYLRKRSLAETTLHMAVLLQEMVKPVCSGVAFSRNPLTGLHETVVEAVNGQGTALVQDGVTPYRWTYSRGAFTSCSEEQSIPLAVIQQVVDGVRQASDRLGRDVDMEWVYDGQDVYWVQMREITSLGGMEVYSSRIAREMLAGMIKPLIWSINIPLVGSVVVRVLSSLIGPNDLSAARLVRPFYYRAYFNMTLLGEVFNKLGIPAESLEIMWGINDDADASPKQRSRGGMKMAMDPRMLRHLPRILRFAWDKWTLHKRVGARLDELEAAYRAVDIEAAKRMTAQDLIAAVDQLYEQNAEMAYYNIIIPLSMYIYNSILRRQLTRRGVDFALLDMRSGLPDFTRYDPNVQMAELHREFTRLPVELRDKVSRLSFEEIQRSPQLISFATRIQDFLVDFGHLCDNGNDFSTVPWRENVATILKLIEEYSERPDTSQGGESEQLRFEDLRLPWPARLLLGGLYRRASQFTLYREQTSYIYTYGYGLFRVYFQSLAGQLVRQGWLVEDADIYFLELAEIRQLVNGQSSPAEIQTRVSERRQEFERVRHVSLPGVIFGDQPPPVESGRKRKLVGTPTSRGYCTAPIRVVTGLQDFPKVRQGDILVIPFSDVGWTPLFARAGGIIAESGGMLSHSSIVAREYGIPAIVSVTGATHLPDDALVSMDGFKGEIYIHEECLIGEE